MGVKGGRKGVGRPDLRKLMEFIYNARLQRADLSAKRFLQEHKIRSREQEIEQLKAMAYLKVMEAPENKAATEEERKNRVICVLMEDKSYRQALTAISRHQLIANRLNAEMAVLEAGIKKAESEEQWLFLEIEQNREHE